MARLGFVELIDFGGQDEIALRQAVNFVRPGRDLDFSPGKEDVRQGSVSDDWRSMANVRDRCLLENRGSRRLFIYGMSGVCLWGCP